MTTAKDHKLDNNNYPNSKRRVCVKAAERAGAIVYSYDIVSFWLFYPLKRTTVIVSNIQIPADGSSEFGLIFLQPLNQQVQQLEALSYSVQRDPVVQSSNPFSRGDHLWHRHPPRNDDFCISIDSVTF